MLDYMAAKSSDGFSCRIVRDPQAREVPGQFIFMADDEQPDLWVCVAAVPASLPFAGMFIPVEEEANTSRLCALLGMEWECFEEDFYGIVGWQRRCRGHLERDGNVARQLARATPAEVFAWREELRAKTSGELLRAHLTGDDPRAVSN